jgi:hypothetical protein
MRPSPDFVPQRGAQRVMGVRGSLEDVLPGPVEEQHVVVTAGADVGVDLLLETPSYRARLVRVVVAKEHAYILAKAETGTSNPACFKIPRTVPTLRSPGCRGMTNELPVRERHFM